ncbi:MAG: hypothetical protein AAB774_01155 [Patescibacteria group bacterium]
MKTIWRLLAISLLLGAFILPAQAAEFRSEKDSVVVKETETPKDLHLVGKNIIVDADTTGDLLLAGETILANGKVENSLFIAGGTITVRSHVLRHVRIAGGTVTLSGRVDGDVYIAGGDVTIADSAEIMGGLYVASGTLNISGKVLGQLKVGGGEVIIDGSVGSTKIYGDSVRLTNKAKINGDFNYEAAKPASIDTAAVITGQTYYTEPPQVDRYGLFFGSAFTLGHLLRLLGAILLGWLLIRFWPRTSRKVVDFAVGSPMSAIGYGLLSFFLVSLGGLVLLFTIVGMSLAGVILTLWLLTMMLGSIFGKITLGSWLYRLFKHDESYQLTIGTVSLGIVVSSILMLVPVIGPLVVFITFLLGVGSVFNLILHSLEIAPASQTDIGGISDPEKRVIPPPN